MSDTQREYSGWLQARVNQDQRERLSAVAREAGLILEVADGYIEFEYQGRDSNRFVVKFLAKVAAIVGDADGEVRCDVELVNSDPIFEFYSFKGGKLVRQIGRILRGAVELVEVPD